MGEAGLPTDRGASSAGSPHGDERGFDDVNACIVCSCEDLDDHPWKDTVESTGGVSTYV
jgi:hypothetical protein